MFCSIYCRKKAFYNRDHLISFCSIRVTNDLFSTHYQGSSEVSFIHLNINNLSKSLHALFICKSTPLGIDTLLTPSNHSLERIYYDVSRDHLTLARNRLLQLINSLFQLLYSWIIALLFWSANVFSGVS